MKSFVWKAMADGAVGFSTGLQYVPGAYAHQPEIIELAHVAADAGGIYASHMRNEGTELEEAIAETIRVGEAAGARVQISHLKVDSPAPLGRQRGSLAVDRCRESQGTRRRGRSVRLHRGELLAQYSIPRLGAGRRSGANAGAAERPRHLGEDQA